MECVKCKKDKSSEEFHLRSKATGKKRQAWCKVCRKEYDKTYHRNRHLTGKKKEQYKINRERNRLLVFKYLTDNHCVECGEADPVVLEFNHLRDKKDDISSAVSSAWSTENITKEIAKCEILCANCHRRKTAKQFGYWILGYVGV